MNEIIEKKDRFQAFEVFNEKNRPLERSIFYNLIKFIIRQMIMNCEKSETFKGNNVLKLFFLM